MARWQPFEWIVASRFLREGRLQTLFIIAGVAIGVAVIVFMSALLEGLQGNFVRRVLTASPHIQLLPPKETVRALHATDTAPDAAQHAAQLQAPLQRLKSIDQWQSVLAQLRAMPDVRDASPVVSGSTLILRGSTSRSLSVQGVESESYERIVNLSEKI
ncbi:MAG: ABC transporter permease, partial [Burkholderiaceae bacterium]|nr:ABC transporter permease [Burkholderiaceae bacterium]